MLIKSREKFFWFVADENGVFYSPLDDLKEQKRKIENQRAKILVFLIESGFAEQNITLDYEMKANGFFETIDLVAFSKEEPFLAADFLPEGASENAQEQAKTDLLRKAKYVKAKKACLFVGKEKNCFIP